MMCGTVLWLSSGRSALEYRELNSSLKVCVVKMYGPNKGDDERRELLRENLRGVL